MAALGAKRRVAATDLRARGGGPVRHPTWADTSRLETLAESIASGFPSTTAARSRERLASFPPRVA